MSEKEIWTPLKILAWTKDYLATKGIENARLEAEWMLCAATGLDRVGLYLNFDKPLNETELNTFRGMIARRAKREPLQHILGTQEFCGMEFEVSPAVLIPRHDTETLVYEAATRMPQATSILDIGTGSGCIAVALARQFPNATVTATDISPAALEIAMRNAARNSVKIEFIQGSLFEPFDTQTFDLIVSNPPYIPTADIETLEPEVRHGDPFNALDGGDDGLHIYRQLIPEAAMHLNTGGWLLVEVGAGQAEDVSTIFRGTDCYNEPVTVSDQGGIMRVVAADRKG